MRSSNKYGELMFNPYKLIKAIGSKTNKEKYSEKNEDGINAIKYENDYSDISQGILIFLLIVTLSIYIWALVVLIQNSNKLSNAMLALSIILFIYGCPICTLIIVYIGRRQQ
jgi:hypothetical protein